MSKTVSVLSFERDPGPCPKCGQAGTCFVRHKFSGCCREDRPIETRCRPCIEEEAGGVEKVHVKSTYPFLAKVWDGRKALGQRLNRQVSRAIGSGRF